MKKRWATRIIAMGLASMMTVSTWAQTTKAPKFEDVPNTHWAYSGISYMQTEGYMEMDYQGNFFPDKVMTYFDFAELLANITGYEDAESNPFIDEALRTEISRLYTQQMPTIQQYAGAYTTWRTEANEAIAYVLGKGYMKTSDLERFMVQSGQGLEVNKALTKQELARYLVIYMGRANVAEAEYDSTGFADEGLIREENRPYVAYLKDLGIVSGDSRGNFGANDPVTRALAASMTTTVMSKKATLDEMSYPVVVPEVLETESLTGEVKAVLGQGDGYALLIDVAGDTRFYTYTDQTVTKDLGGYASVMDRLKVGYTVRIKATSDRYLTQLEIDLPAGRPVDASDLTLHPGRVNVQKDTYEGDITNLVRDGMLTVYTDKGALTYTMARGCDIISSNRYVPISELGVGDRVRIDVEDGEVVRITILEKAA